MLLTLHIENIAVIEKAEISFTDGFNVLTGETGAGKSIVIDSINAILGERTSKDIIRNGCENAVIVAEFSVKDATKEHIAELGYDCDDNELIIQRKLSADGKSSVRINGKPATVGILKEIGINLINIHGQHDSQRLLDPDSHLEYVDAMADNEFVFDDYYKSYKELVAVKHQIQKLSGGNDNNQQLSELLEYQINELEAAQITIGERESLINRRKIIKNHEKIAENLNFIRQSFDGDDDEIGINGLMRLCADKLDELIPFGSQYDSLAQNLRNLEIECEDISSGIAEETDSSDFDPAELDNIEQRLNLLYDLSIKYGDTEEKMLQYLSDAKSKLRKIENYDNEIAELESKFSELLEITKGKAALLTDSRISAADRLSKSVCDQLKFLDMPYVQFLAVPTKTKLTARGAETFEFLISTNPGEPLKPMSKIASGGELSRIMLAIKSVMSGADSVETLIFDEIDTGISGSAAQKVGEKIHFISKSKQVICVTHLAQIAAMADSHFLISKSSDNIQSYTDVTRLDNSGRVSEIARIISGGEMTDNLRRTAEEMINKRID